MTEKKSLVSWRAFSTTGQGLLLLLVIIVSLNIISSRLYFRFDVTKEKIFTLSEGTRTILSHLNSPVSVKFYFSRTAKELPPMVKTYASRVEEVLREYSARSGGQLTVEVYDPRPDTDDEEWARRYGLNGVRLPSGDEAFLGAVFIQGKKEIPIPFFDLRTEEFLEKDLSEALVRLGKDEKPKIGLLSSLALKGQQMPFNFGGGSGEGPWVLYNELDRNFSIEEIHSDVVEIPENIPLVLVFHPKKLPDAAQYALDQFVLRGGRLIVVVDPFSRYDVATMGQMMQQSGRMPESSSDLPKLFATWDVEYNATEIVGDQERMVMISANGMRIPYPFFMNLNDDSFSKDSPISYQLKNILVGEPGGFMQKSGSGYAFESLVHTTAASGTVSNSLAAMVGPTEFAQQFKPDGKTRSLVAMVRGKFKSAFPGGAPAAEAGEGEKKSPSKAHVPEAENEVSVLLIGDTDMFADQNAVDVLRIGNQAVARYRNDNLALLLNAVDFLSGSEELISIRSRGRIARPFTKVQEIQSVAQQRWKDEEDKLSARLTDLQTKLSQLEQQKADGSRLMLSPQQQVEIDRFREEQIEVKRRRREVRKNLREDIERLGNRLAVANLLVVPMMVTGFGFGVFVKRTRRMKQGRSK